MSGHHRLPLAGVALLLAAALGCASDVAEPETEPGVETGARPAALSATTEAGPVKATVTAEPQAPLLGDPLTLTLTVEAEPDVTVEMPAFGEALGRFSILDFTPRQSTGADGGVVLSQRYRLQPPMSGKQRIPPLRIEFLDQREGSTTPDADDNYRELLTDELTVEIVSVLPEGTIAAELRPPRDMLPELRTGFFARYWPWIVVAVVLIGGLAWLVPFLQRRARERARITAFDRAMRRLQQLEQRGLPAEDEQDGWYVELSDIVRRYLEDRYGVRAPELTTEEFLNEAKRSAELTGAHRTLLSTFLEHCDRVKFGQYHPEQAETRQELDLARRFLEETRLAQEREPAPADRSAA